MHDHLLGPEDAAASSGPFVFHREEDAGGDPVHVAFTSVEAGNLAFHVLPDGSGAQRDRAREGVVGARTRLEEAMGVAPGSTAFVDQIHSADVVVADGSGWAAGPVRTGDALVCADGSQPLAIMVADCLPVVFADPVTGATAVAHAGRRGLLDGVLQNTLDRLEGLRRERSLEAGGPIRAWIGPGVCGRCYEVPAQMRDESVARLPESSAVTSWGTPALDLPAGARAVLATRGVEVEHVDLCTVEDERLFSHRRAPGRGRFAGLVWRTL
ncbi:polyphenol oxidase family protein [Micrococcus luteus]